ncbi:MAG: response regulator [Sphingobacteriia bacterium]
METTQFSNFTLLITDDDYINRIVIQRVLKDISMKIETAENGLLAIQYINAHLEDKIILLLDINMPEMNGYEVIELLRNDKQKYKNIKTIIVSASNYEEVVEKNFHKDVFGFLSKPVDKNTLTESILSATK